MFNFNGVGQALPPTSFGGPKRAAPGSVPLNEVVFEKVKQAVEARGSKDDARTSFEVLLKQNADVVKRYIVWLYGLQTPKEKAEKKSIYLNYRGFDKEDALPGSDLALDIEAKKPIPSYGIAYGQVVSLQHAGQLMRVGETAAQKMADARWVLLGKKTRDAEPSRSTVLHQNEDTKEEGEDEDYAQSESESVATESESGDLSESSEAASDYDDDDASSSDETERIAKSRRR